MQWRRMLPCVKKHLPEGVQLPLQPLSLSRRAAGRPRALRGSRALPTAARRTSSSRGPSRLRRKEDVYTREGWACAEGAKGPWG